MTLKIIINDPMPLDNKTDIKLFINNVCTEKNISSGELEFTFLSDSEIHQINKKHLNHDYPTFLAYLSNGLLFDAYHAIGNVAFVILLSAPLGDLMTRKDAIKQNRAVISVATS